MEYKMKAHPKLRELHVTATVAGPRELVWRALTEPALMEQWWGPRRFTLVVERNDVVPGGEYRFTHRDAEGEEHRFRGIYSEVEPPERLVYTFVDEGTASEPQDHPELIETVILEEEGSKTKIKTIDRVVSVSELEAMLGEGMEEGMVESYERLEELLYQLQAEKRKAR